MSAVRQPVRYVDEAEGLPALPEQQLEAGGLPALPGQQVEADEELAGGQSGETDPAETAQPEVVK